MHPPLRPGSVPLLTIFLCSMLHVSTARSAESDEAADVRFPTSCTAVQSEFDRAATMLHSFEYPESKRLFRRILTKDRDCAMARWGIAMSIWHPLWAPPSTAELEAGARILTGTESMRTTPREAGFLMAVRAFFPDTEPLDYRQRSAAYSERMAKLYEEYRDDPEVAAFYALSLLATADPHDKNYAHQFKAAALLNRVRELHPRHPGVLHYIIHSYDFPGLAHLALGAATAYADVAPDSAHAQHMPSHIFTRLGMWERSIDSNHRSTASAAAYTKRANLPGHYDEGLHSIDYLMYAMLQIARDDDALRLLQSLGTIGKTNVDNFKVAYTYAASPARYALERHEWLEASRLQLGFADFPWRDFPWAQSIHHFARGIGAARSNQVDLAREELENVTQLQSGISDAMPPYWREEMFVHADAVASWIALAEGQRSEALRLAAAAANREDSVDKHPVTPGEVLPARELYADMLLEVGRNDEALQQYRKVLRSSPNRYNSVLGAARAAERSGRSDDAHSYYRRLTEIADAQNPGRDSLVEALRYLNTSAR